MFNVKGLLEFIFKFVWRCFIGCCKFYLKVFLFEFRFLDEILKMEEKEIDDFMRKYKKESGYGVFIKRVFSYMRYIGVVIVLKIRERRCLEVFEILDEVIDNDLDLYMCVWGYENSCMIIWLFWDKYKMKIFVYVKEGVKMSVGMLKYYSVFLEKFEFLMERKKVGFFDYIF